LPVKKFSEFAGTTFSRLLQAMGRDKQKEGW